MNISLPFLHRKCRKTEAQLQEALDTVTRLSVDLIEEHHPQKITILDLARDLAEDDGTLNIKDLVIAAQKAGYKSTRGSLTTTLKRAGWVPVLTVPGVWLAPATSDED